MALAIGDKAPKFKATSNNGDVSLSDFKGKWLVLFFYPKDDTETCTQEACNFRDSYERITAFGAEVIGVSPDDLKSHSKFIKKYNLNYNLISDDKLKIAKAYSAWGDKILFGKKYMGILRSTFIIDPKGKICYANNKVRVPGHIDNIIKELTKLQSI